MSLAPPRRILIVKASSLGDVVHALPVSAALKRRFPDARLTWVVERMALGALEGNRYVDEILVSDFKRWKKRPFALRSAREFLRFARLLRAVRADVAFDFQGLTKSGLITFFSGAPVRIGLDGAHSRERMATVYTNRRVTPPEAARHVVDQLFSALAPLGVRLGERREFPLWIGEDAQADADVFLRRWGLERDRPRVALNPGGGWITKRWGAARFAELGDRIAREFGVAPAILWGPGEEGLVAEMRRRMRAEPAVIPPMDVKGLLAVIARMDLVVAGDTGPIHMAAALGVPTVGIYGPSDPERNGPYGDGHEIVRAEETPCLGCFRRACPVRWCMEDLETGPVFDAVRRALAVRGFSGAVVPSRAPRAPAEDDAPDGAPRE